MINSSGFEFDEIPFVIKIARNNFLNFLIKKTSPKFLIKKSLKEVYYDDKLISKSIIKPSDFTYLNQTESADYLDKWKSLKELRKKPFKNKRFKSYH